ERRTPLPGHRVMITFDDGYADFVDHAAPLLRRHGFTAMVFLVSDRIGSTNEWDTVYGETLPLLDWEVVRSLQAEGIDFGSHTATHPKLTGLSPAQVVRELARSRATLEQRLERRVTAVAYPHGD